MTVTVNNFLSWPVAVWLSASIVVVVATWRFTTRIKKMWQRTFFRAGIIALCFTPIPTPEMFGEVALVGHLKIIPLWSALSWSITHGSLLGIAATFISWLVVTYLLWVGGMSIHHLFRNKPYG
jgi:hypothetical protein